MKPTMLIVVALLFCSLFSVFLPEVEAVGIYAIRMDPCWPTVVASPATFETWVCEPFGSAYDLRVLIVMTEDCFDGLAGNVLLTDSGLDVIVASGAFTAVTSNIERVPTGHTVEYMVAALKDHIDEGLSVPLSPGDAIYWALAEAPFSEPLSETHVEFTVTVPSSDARALIYVMGSSVEDSGDLDMGVPATTAGFVVSNATPPVGGEWVPMGRLQLLIPWISFAASVAIAASFVGNRRIKKRQDDQSKRYLS